MADRVTSACAACFDAHRDDCSGFVRAVGNTLGVKIAGDADDIVQTLRAGGSWTKLADGVAAAARAKAGQFVVAGLPGREQTVPNAHGHVVVVVDGPLAHDRYPTAWWGSLGGKPAEDETLNYAWVESDRDRITYAAHAIT